MMNLTHRYVSSSIIKTGILYDENIDILVMEDSIVYIEGGKYEIYYMLDTNEF